MFQQDNAQADTVQLSAQGVVVQTLANAVVLTWQAGGRFVLDLGTGRTLEDAPNGEQVLTYANGDRLTAGVTGFMLTEHADGTWTRSWPTGLMASAFPAASDGTANPAASINTTVALDGTGSLVVTLPDGSTITTADAFTQTPGTPTVTLATGSSAVEQTDHSVVITTTADAQGRFTIATWGPEGSVTIATQQYPTNTDGTLNLTGTPSLAEQWAYAPDGTATHVTPGADIAGPDNTTISTSVTQVTATGGTVTSTESDGTLDANNQPRYKTTVQSVDGMTVVTQADGSSQTSFLDGSSQTQAADGTLRHWAADQKTLTTTLTDGSVIDRAADGTLTVTLPAGGSSLLTQNADGSWTATLSGIQWLWANDGSGAITTVATDDTTTEARLDGTTLTTKPDGILITASADGRTVQANVDGTVITQSSSGARWQEDVAKGQVTLATAQGETWQILPDPQVTKWGTDGTVTQWTDQPGSSRTWNPDGSQTSVAHGLTTLRAADGTRTLTDSSGGSVTISATGTVSATDLTAQNDGSYDVGGGTQVAPNGVITTTLEDGSTLTELANGVVSLQAHDGTFTIWTPPGVSTNYPNGYVSRAHADGPSEGWYTADDTVDATGWLQHPDAVYVRRASDQALTELRQYGNGVQMQVDRESGRYLSVITPTGAVLTSSPNPYSSLMLAPGVTAWTQIFTQTQSGFMPVWDAVALHLMEPPSYVPRFFGDGMCGVYAGSLPAPTARVAAGREEGAAPQVRLLPPYRLSDPGGAALAALAASGHRFAIGASLDAPASLWTGNTVEEVRARLDITTNVFTGDSNILWAGPGADDEVSRQPDWGWFLSTYHGHAAYIRNRIPLTFLKAEHTQGWLEDGWNYLIDGVTHHSATKLNVWAIVPPAAQKFTATFYQDPGRTDPNDFTSDDEQKVIHYDKMDAAPTMQLNQYTGLPEYTFTLDGVDYISDGIPPDISMDVSKTALPPVPENPLIAGVTTASPNVASVDDPVEFMSPSPAPIPTMTGPTQTPSPLPTAQINSLYYAALQTMSQIFPRRGARLQQMASPSRIVLNINPSADPKNTGGGTVPPTSSGGLITMKLNGREFAERFPWDMYYKGPQLHNPTVLPPVLGMATLMHELEHVRHISELGLTTNSLNINKYLEAKIKYTHEQIEHQLGSLPVYKNHHMIPTVNLSNIQPAQDSRYDFTFFTLFTEFIAWRGGYTTLKYMLDHSQNLSTDSHVFNPIGTPEYQVLTQHVANIRHTLGQLQSALSRYITYFGNQSPSSQRIQDAMTLVGGRPNGMAVYNQFKAYYAYFMGSKVENMLNSNGTYKTAVPSLTTPDRD